jgi:hypothetical protein
MRCTCDRSSLFPRCDRNAECPKSPREFEAGYSTGKWSDDDDMHPTITPFFGQNR